MKKILQRRADLLMKWQFSEGRRTRAVWLDGSQEAERQLAVVRQMAHRNELRRMI